MGFLLAKVARVGRLDQFRVIVTLLLGTGALMLCPGPARGQLMIDGIAAVVNDKVITFQQIKAHVAETERLYSQTYQGAELQEKMKEAQLDVLKALIDRELIIQDFKKSGGAIPDTFVNERVNDEIRERYGGDRIVFIKTLYEQGETMAKFRDDIADNAIVQYMRTRNVAQTVLVSPYQIEQYYQQNLRLFQQDEQIKISTIVLRKSQFPSTRMVNGRDISYDPQEDIAKEILYKLDTGSDFADLARADSEASNKDDGGALGWVTEKGKLAIRADLWPYIA
jgi:peptidyl-prolyl cis-trans isomerase SurA